PALRSGLRRDERRVQHTVGFGVQFLQRLNELDAAALASAARVDLRLDDEGFAAELAGDRRRLLWRVGYAAVGNRSAIVLEQGLGLGFVNVHWVRCAVCEQKGLL